MSKTAKTPERPTVNLGDPQDRDDGEGSLSPIGGSLSKTLNTVLVNQAVNALWLPPTTSSEDRNKLYVAAATAMMEFKPKDGIEGMMGAQAFGLHTAAMECLRRAMLPDQPFEAADRLRRQAANLVRTFLDVLAGLDRKRGKGGHQTVRIERVQIAPGGHAAIVGTVNTGEGGRHAGETGEEPHAPPARLAHDAALGAVIPPVRGQDPGGVGLPVACDVEWPVPDARGRLDGA